MRHTMTEQEFAEMFQAAAALGCRISDLLNAEGILPSPTCALAFMQMAVIAARCDGIEDKDTLTVFGRCLQSEYDVAEDA